MPSVTGPDGRKLNFPAGTPQDQVLAVLKQQYPDSFGGQAAPIDDRQARYDQRLKELQSADQTNYDPSVGGGTLRLGPINTGIPTPQWFERGAAGLGKSLADSVRGTYQAGVDSANRGLAVADTGLRAIGADSAAQGLARTIGAPVAREARQLEANVARDRQLDAPLMNTGAGIGGNVVGTLAQFVGPGIAARGTMAGAALLPRTIRGNAALGTVAGFAQPNTGAGDQATNTVLGGTLGGVGAAVPRAATAGAGYLNRMRTGIDPLTQRAGAQLREAATNPNAISFQQSAIPGVNRTVGEATTDPGLQALEQTMRQQHRGAFQQVDRGNNMARAQFIEGQGLSPADYRAADLARTRAGSEFKDEAMRAGPVGIGETMARLDSAIDSMEGRPAVQGALEQVKGLLTKDPRIGSHQDKIHVLENVRMTIGDMLSGKYGGDSAAALQGSRELIALRDSLNREIGDQVPAFTNYLDAYRMGSGDINRTDIWREVADRGSAIPDAETGYRTLTPGQFFRATNDLDSLAQRATDFSKARAEDILTQGDMDAISALSDDLRRVASRQQSPGTGSQTAAHLTQLARQMGRGATSGTPLVGQSIDAALGALDGATQQKVLYLVLNPAKAEEVLRAMPTRDREALQSVLTQIAVSAPAQATRTGTPELVN